MKWSDIVLNYLAHCPGRKKRKNIVLKNFAKVIANVFPSLFSILRTKIQKIIDVSNEYLSSPALVFLNLFYTFARF